MILKHYFRRSILNNIKNWYIQKQASNRTDTPEIEIGNASPPSNYKLVFEDDFSERFLDKTKWRASQPWGEFHSEQLWWYWPTDETAIQIEDNTLKLDLRYFPKTFKKSEVPKWQQAEHLPETWTAPHAAGLVATREQFKYGWFEAEVKLPKQINQWTAFWLMSKEKWPPEIDIFEAYSPDTPDEIEVKPNIHWGTGNHWKEGKKDYGAPKISVQDPADRFVKYACHWTEDFIRFYVDGFLVQEATNKEMLEQVGEYPQYLILNHGLVEPPKDVKYYSTMEVKNVKIYQNEGTILS